MPEPSTTFQATIEQLKHKRSETAGTAPATTITLDAGALDIEVATKLLLLQDGHPVQVTIERMQEKMPLDPPDKSRGFDKDVPGALRESFQEGELDPRT